MCHINDANCQGRQSVLSKSVIIIIIFYIIIIINIIYARLQSPFNLLTWWRGS